MVVGDDDRVGLGALRTELVDQREQPFLLVGPRRRRVEDHEAIDAEEQAVRRRRGWEGRRRDARHDHAGRELDAVEATRRIRLRRCVHPLAERVQGTGHQVLQDQDDRWNDQDLAASPRVERVGGSPEPPADEFAGADVDLLPARHPSREEHRVVANGRERRRADPAEGGDRTIGGRDGAERLPAVGCPIREQQIPDGLPVVAQRASQSCAEHDAHLLEQLANRTGRQGDRVIAARVVRAVLRASHPAGQG